MGSRNHQELPLTVETAALHGLAGDIVRCIEPHTEADPAAILIQSLVAFGVLVGRGPHVRIEGDEHHANLYALLVGNTSKGRKGTSWGRVRQIFERIEGWPKEVKGLSSGEGLKWAVRDPAEPNADGKGTPDDGVRDKRLLVIESEFAQTLRVAARPGNTLSVTVREAWDSGRLATLTKNDAITATDTHVAIVGHITADELRAELTATDTANGFANRFLFVGVRRSKKLPFGGEALPDAVIAGLAGRLARAAISARTLGRISMTGAARGIWARVYGVLSEGHPGLLGAATGRAEAQCIRLALLYALLDEARAIDVPHLLAAVAVWEYCEQSAQAIFGSALGDPIADDILRAIRAAATAGLTRTEISALFKRHKSAERIGVALESLERRGVVWREHEPTLGRSAETWRAN
jgi:hypothetical protein